MNIKISKEQADFILNQNNYKTYLIGSRLYGTNKIDSDYDFLIIYKNFHNEIDMFYPNYHQLQYDEIGDNKQLQLMFTSENQFYRNLFSGDATINADIVMFTNFNNYNDSEKLNILRTFNIIKAYIGFAKRDIKYINKGKNKIFHIERGLYCAEKLINNELPNLEDIKFIYNNPNLDIKRLKQCEEDLRYRCNNLFENNELTLFPKLPIIDPKNDIEKLLIESNNIKEFKY